MPPDPADRTPNWLRRAIALVGFALLILGPWLVQRGHLGLTADSYSYLNTAWHLAREGSAVLSQVDATRTLSPEAIVLRPLTQWPPGYPLLCALCHRLGAPLDLAGWIVAYSSTVGALVLAWLIVRRHTVWWWSLPAAAILATMPAVTPLAMFAWSEGTALLLLMAAWWWIDLRLPATPPNPPPEQAQEGGAVDLAHSPLLGSARRGVGGGGAVGGAWLPLALLTIAGFHVRYAFLLLAPGLLAGLWLSLPTRRSRWRGALLYCGTVAIGCAPWLIRNVFLTGALEGKSANPGVFTTLAFLEEGLQMLFGIPMPGIGWAAGLSVVIVLLFGIMNAWEFLRERQRGSRLLLFMAAAVSYVLLLALAYGGHRYDAVSYRFLAPATLLLLIPALIVAGEYLSRGGIAPLYGLLVWLVPIPVLAYPIPGLKPAHQIFGVLCLVVIAEAIIRLGPRLRYRAPGWMILIGILGLHTIGVVHPLLAPRPQRHRDLAAWLREHAPAGAVYAGTRAARDLLLEAPEYLQFISLATTQDRPEGWVDAEGFYRLRARYGLRYLVLPGPPSPYGAGRYGPYMQRLMTAHELPPEHGRVFESPSWRIIELALPPTPLPAEEIPLASEQDTPYEGLYGDEGLD